MDRGPCRSWLAGDRLRSSRKIGTCAVPDRMRMQGLRLLRSRSPASQLLQEPWRVELATTVTLDPGIVMPAHDYVDGAVQNFDNGALLSIPSLHDLDATVTTKPAGKRCPASPRGWIAVRVGAGLPAIGCEAVVKSVPAQCQPEYACRVYDCPAAGRRQASVYNCQA